MGAVFEALGWVGQCFFFARFGIQWLTSEQQKRSTTPRIFWWLSVAGSVLVGAAAVQKGEWLLVPAFLINGSIYVRNLWMQPGSARLNPIPAAALGLVAAAVAIGLGRSLGETGSALAWPWLAAGICGQAIWSTRFVLQWWFSERRGESHFPLAFWWLSIAGAVLNMTYTSQLDSWLFFVAYAWAWFVPARNLMIEHGRRKAARDTPVTN